MELWMIAVVCVLSAIAGAYVSGQKDRPAPEGFLLGLLFGPLGLIVAGVLPEGRKTPELKVVRPSEYVHRPRKMID